ncbi:uncharacterized protein E0L32_004631 [Thyridium curvatum]|uniref:F-box domain-containing protein n=1 Tax=Thyridium curvatum TaxID=1093900 RepID=A0A507B9R2_9PEZI|nr:uncharacterized protein E0L32_004631 [Thyridium curvatum]TPX15354.1 hypothetical protein E0L32_004631 [Thyridium curvatum]
MTAKVILDLPDELLSHVLTLSVGPLRGYRLRHDGRRGRLVPLASLARVCRRFNRLATPLLYEGIFVSHVYQCSRRPVEEHTASREWQVMKANPSTRQFCRRLEIDAARSDQCDKHTSEARDLIKWLTNTTTLKLHSWPATYRDTGSLARLALTSMPRLRSLTLTGWKGSTLRPPVVREALAGFGYSLALRSLHLQHIGEHEGTLEQWAELTPHALSVTKLTVFEFLQTSKVLSHLIQWVKRLEHLEIHYLFSADYAGNETYIGWSLGKLQPMLELQRDSLTCISISHICVEGLAGFDVTSFPNLRFLSLCYRATGLDIHLVSRLAAPRLNRFRWDLTLQDQQCSEQLGHLDEPQEKFLRAVAQTLLVELKVPLREILVQFRPEYDHWLFGAPWAPEVLPWDRLDSIQRDYSEHGLAVICSPPGPTEEERFDESKLEYGGTEEYDLPDFEYDDLAKDK